MIPENLSHHILRHAGAQTPVAPILVTDVDWPDSGVHVRTVPRSACLAWNETDLRANNHQGFFHHHAGLGGECRDAAVLLWRLLANLRERLSIADPVPTDPQSMRDVLPNWLARAAATGGQTILVENAHEISRDGLTADLDWLPAWLPADVSLLLTTTPGPAAEQFRDIAASIQPWTASVDADSTASVSSDWLEQPGVDATLPWLWLARTGLKRANLEALSDGVIVDFNPLSPHVISFEDQLMLHPMSRDAVARRFLADHGVRQQMHERMALAREQAADGAELLLASWHWGRAGRRDRVAATLVDERILSALADSPSIEFDSIRSWASLADAAAVRAALSQAAECAERSAPALLGCVRLHEDLLGEPAPLAWLERALAGTKEDRNDPHFLKAVLKLTAHSETDPGTARELLNQALAEPPSDALQRARLFHARAYLFEDDGDLEKAVQNYAQAVTHAEEALAEDPARLLPWLSNLAAAAKAAGDLKAADPHARRALRIARDHLPAGHPALASACDLVAGLAYMNGQYDAAEPLYREALTVTEAAFGPKHPATAACLGNLGSLLDARQQFREAEKCHRRALGILVEIYGDEHSESAGAMHNLAVALESLGKADEAERLYRRALNVWEKVAGEQSPAFATTLLALASVLRDRGEWQEAEALFRADIELWRGMMGPDHPHTLGALTELARLYIDGGKPELAEPLLLHLCDRLAEVSGRSSHASLEAVTLLAGLQHRSGRDDEARALLHSALAASQNTLNMLSAPIQKARRLLDQIEGNTSSSNSH